MPKSVLSGQSLTSSNAGAIGCGEEYEAYCDLHVRFCEMPLHRRDYRFGNYIKWQNSSDIHIRGTITQIQTILQ